MVVSSCIASQSRSQAGVPAKRSTRKSMKARTRYDMWRVGGYTAKAGDTGHSISTEPARPMQGFPLDSRAFVNVYRRTGDPRFAQVLYGPEGKIPAELRDPKLRAAVQETAGAFVTVSDAEILAAIPVLARGCGVFAEPAGAAALAGLQKALEKGLVFWDERVVVINTGNGLKDIPSTMQAMEQAQTRAHPVTPALSAVKAVVAEVTAG